MYLLMWNKCDFNGYTDAKPAPSDSLSSISSLLNGLTGIGIFPVKFIVAADHIEATEERLYFLR